MDNVDTSELKALVSMLWSTTSKNLKIQVFDTVAALHFPPQYIHLSSQVSDLMELRH